MSKPMRRRRAACRAAARTLAIAAALAALAATLAAGQALAVPDEHGLERQGAFDRQTAAGSAWPSRWASSPCSWRLAPPPPGASTTTAPDPSRSPERASLAPARSARTGSPSPPGGPVRASPRHQNSGGAGRSGACFVRTSGG